MENLEVTAKTVEEAIELAIRQLGVERDEVDVVVVTEGRSGILGIGSEPAKVRVTPKDRISKSDTLAKEILTSLIEKMGVSAEVHLKALAMYKDAPELPLSIEITGEDSGLLIGRGGSTLGALQYLVNLLVNRRIKDCGPVNIDVEGYKERRHKALRALAHRLADRVKKSGRPFTLEPMSPAERRIIHLALSENDHVMTQSSGEGASRRVTISPKSRR